MLNKTRRLVAIVCLVLLALPSMGAAQGSRSKTLKTPEVDAILKTKFSRTSDDAFQGVVDLAQGIPAEMSDGDKLALYVRAGAWDKLREALVVYDDISSQRIHTRILSDLNSYGAKPVFVPTDIIGLADASPTPLDDRQTQLLGRLLVIALQGSKSRQEFLALIQRGTDRLGGTTPENRTAAANVFASAELWDEAKEFGLKDRRLPVAFTTAADVPKGDENRWNDALAVLRKSDATAEERTSALDTLHETLVQATAPQAKAKVTALVQDKRAPELTLALLALIGRKTALGVTGVDFAQRTANLELQRVAVDALTKNANLAELPFVTIVNLYARNWISEWLHTQSNYPTWLRAQPSSRDKYQHVEIEKLLETAPANAWLKALTPQLSGSVRLAERLFLMSDKIDRVLPSIRDFVTRDRAQAVELANTYLATWAAKHNPTLTTDAQKQARADTPGIVMTRAEQEVSLAQLSALLEKLDPPTRALLDEAQLVQAFDLCHSRAEIYTRAHVETVFGPIEQMPAPLLRTIVERMRSKLSLQWRDLAVQRDAVTKRTTEDVVRMVNTGYAETDAIMDAWTKGHPEDWRAQCATGSLLSDWAEFAYFQAVLADDDADRFATYLARTAEALQSFRLGAKAYAAELPKRKRSEFELLPYRAWFYGLLGIAQDTDINLRKGIAPAALKELREAIVALPGGAAEAHLELFSAMVADNVKLNRIAPEMKFRYLSSAVQITGRRPTAYPAEEKVQYYESLLSEVRLTARIDGAAKVHTQGDFGALVTLVHTADIARESGGFGKYLMNEVRKTVSGRQITEKPLYRDRFEEALRNALGDFFEIRAIVFADPNAGARDIETDKNEKSATPARRWQETPLAYLHLVSKDNTVDRLPPLEIELDFIDREGKVVIPVPSNPVLIEVADNAPVARPATEIAITQIVDSRELGERRLKMDLVATSRGLVPDLKSLIDLDSFALPTKEIEDREGLLVREFQSGEDGLYAVSERSWTIHFDPLPLLRGGLQKIDFSFPRPKQDSFSMTYRSYNDVDPVEAAATVTLVEGQQAEELTRRNPWAWGLGALAGIAILAGAARYALRAPPQRQAAVIRYELPREVTPFSIATLLHRILASEPTLDAEQQTKLRREIDDLQRSAFAPASTSSPASSAASRDLAALGTRWIHAVSPGSPLSAS